MLRALARAEKAAYHCTAIRGQGLRAYHPITIIVHHIVLLVETCTLTAGFLELWEHCRTVPMANEIWQSWPNIVPWSVRERLFWIQRLDDGIASLSRQWWQRFSVGYWNSSAGTEELAREASELGWLVALQQGRTAPSSLEKGCVLNCSGSMSPGREEHLFCRYFRIAKRRSSLCLHSLLHTADITEAVPAKAGNSRDLVQ